MSIEALKAALEADIDDAPLKAVLVGLANHADPDGGSCRPSIQRLRVYSALSRSTVVERLQQARDLGLIEVVVQGGGRRPTEYRMALDALISMRSDNLPKPTSGGLQGSATRTPAKGAAPIQGSGTRTAAGRDPALNHQLTVLQPLTRLRRVANARTLPAGISRRTSRSSPA